MPYSVTLLNSATVTNRCRIAAEGKEVRICVLISLRCMMSSSPVRQSTRLLRGNAQGAAQGNVNTRRNQARPQPYPDESPRRAAARVTRSRVAPENSRTTPVSTEAAASVSTAVIPSPNTRGAAAREASASVSTVIASPNTRRAAARVAAASVSTVIPSPNTRGAAARASLGAATGIPGPSAPDIPAGGRRSRAAPHASARRVPTTTAAQVPAPAPGTAAVATARAYAGVGINAAPAAVMPANLGQDFVGEALLAQRGGGVAIQGGGAPTRRRQGGQGGQRNTVARSADKFAIQKCVKEYVFPKQKFVTDGDLDFSNNEMSICRCMAAALDVDNRNIENWWETARKTVKESIYRHRNNTIKKIKTVFQGKMVASVHFNHLILNF